MTRPGSTRKKDELVSDLDFYADVLRAGTVLGLDAHSTPEQVTGVLGGEFGEFRAKDVLVRDFGLVEFTWERGAAGGPWRGLRFSIQAHRLERVGPAVVNPALVRAYGAFPTEAPCWGPLRERIDPRLWPIGEQPSTDPSLRELWQADSQVTVLLGPRADASSAEVDGLPVYQISAGPVVPRADGRSRRSSLDHVGHLRHLSEVARRDWLDRRRPCPEQRVNWWLHHLEAVKARLAQDAEQRAAWIGLELWLIDEGERQGVFTPLATAEKRAWFVSELHHRYAPLPADAGIPRRTPWSAPAWPRSPAAAMTWLDALTSARCPAPRCCARAVPKTSSGLPNSTATGFAIRASRKSWPAGRPSGRSWSETAQSSR